MADYTPNYNLKKPASTDFVDIEDLNGNADIIDETLAAKADLDEDGKVPTSQLPSQGNYIPVSEKGAANGVATLDDTGKVPSTQVPGYDTTESHIADTTKHVTAEDKETWNGLDDFVRIAVPTTGWVENADGAYPLKNVVTVTSCRYNHPIWGVAGATDETLPTEEEMEAYNATKLMYAEDTTLTFYTSETTAPATFYAFVQGVVSA